MASPHPNDLYATPPPWDIGRPQPALRALAITGRVLDAGCGTGEHTLMAAGLGLDATGIDLASDALSTAEQKARDRGLTARFLHHDARQLTELAELGEAFDTVLDCGLFHTFDDGDRAAYVAGLQAVLRPGGRYFMLCISDAGKWGPHGVSREEISAAFTDGWRIDSIEPATIEVVGEPDGVASWQVALVRILVSEARVPTDRPDRYADQLVRHAGHLRGHRGAPRVLDKTVHLGSSRCTFTTTHDALILRAEATTEQDLRRIQQLVGGRLEKIGRRDGLAVHWRQ
jgi:SAM-dependent methyltransferase